MRSGRGKCPQCKEIIVVDLDAPEIRCPFCNALLKKSAKTVAEARAEKEAQEALAREEAAAAAAAQAEAAKAVEEAAQETPVAEPAAEEIPVEPAKEEVPVSVEPEAAEAPTEQPDEIGLSDEELAAMDEAPAEEKEEAPAEEQPDEIGLSDEELAAMDEAPNEAMTAESEAASEPEVFGSIGADEEEATPEEAEAAELDDEPVAKEEEAPIGASIELADDVDPALLDEDLAALDDIPVTEKEEESEPAEEASAESEVAPAAEAPAAEEIPVEEAAPAEEAVVDAPAEEEVPAEETVAEEPVAEEAPAEEVPVAEEVEVAPAEEAKVEQPVSEAPLGYTEEDMAFAASLSDSVVAPQRPTKASAPVAPVRAAVVKKEEPPKKVKKSKEKASKGNDSEGESIYKKPIAIILAVLSVLAIAFHLLYVKVSTFGLISADLAMKLEEKLPIFGGENFAVYLYAITFGLIGLIAIFGLTGKKGKIGFLFVLLADLVYAFVSFAPTFKVEAINKILVSYGGYVPYVVYGLLLVGAIFFAVAMVAGKEDYEFSGLAAILPILYAAVALLGYFALVFLPKFVESFVLSEQILRYVLIGLIAAPVLLTLIGVHSAKASRSANGWLIFATIAAIALLRIAYLVIEEIAYAKGVDLNAYFEITYVVTPLIAYVGVLGFAISDLRN